MKISAPAKINMTLEVFGVRADGYHALRSVVMPISLADEIEIELAAEVVSDTGYDDDLCVKAAKVLDPSRGARIHVVKRIPVGGGLGGGSADAAAVMIALNSLWGLGLTVEELAAAGSQVGSDVPALILAHDGYPVLMEGRGEKVSRLAAGDTPIDIVLVNPRINVSTRDVYARCGERRSSERSRSDDMAGALARGDRAEIAKLLMNDLQPVAIDLHPGIADVVASLRTAGVEGVLMSGSGSTVFGIVPSEARGREIAASMEQKGYWSGTFHTLVP